MSLVLAGYTAPDERPTRKRREPVVTTKRAIAQGLPLCVVCLSRWVSKAEQVTCSTTCRRIHNQREAMRATNAKKTLTFPKEPLL